MLTCSGLRGFVSWSLNRSCGSCLGTERACRCVLTTLCCGQLRGPVEQTGWWAQPEGCGPQGRGTGPAGAAVAGVTRVLGGAPRAGVRRGPAGLGRLQAACSRGPGEGLARRQDRAPGSAVAGQARLLLRPCPAAPCVPSREGDGSQPVSTAGLLCCCVTNHPRAWAEDSAAVCGLLSGWTFAPWAPCQVPGACLAAGAQLAALRRSPA